MPEEVGHMENSLKLLVDWDEFSKNLASALTRCDDLISNLQSVNGEDSFLKFAEGHRGHLSAVSFRMLLVK